MHATDSHVWNEIVVDRRDTVSPFRQIANAIRHKIATNQIAANTVMPSVRSLSDQVGVTAATVARAYRQLQSDGLVEARVGVGTVVSDTRHLVYQAARRSPEELDAAVDAALTPVLQMGYSPTDLRASIDRRLARASEAHLAIVVSDALPVLKKYVLLMKQELAPLGVSVDGMLLGSLKGDEHCARARQATRVLTSLGLLRKVQEALARCGATPTLSIIFTELDLSTIERLSAIPKEARTLVVAEERYRTSILGILRQHLPHENVTMLHHLDEPALRDELERCEVVVHTLGTSELVGAAASDRQQTILMDYRPRPDAMAKLRESFRIDAS